MKVKSLMDYPILDLESERDLMAYLSERSYTYVKLEVENMSREEARRIWRTIEKNWSYVALRSGKGISGSKMQWLSLLRKMGLLERKAKEEEGE